LPTPPIFIFYFLFLKRIYIDASFGNRLDLVKHQCVYVPHRRVGILWCYADSMLLPPVDNLSVHDLHFASSCLVSSSSIFGRLKVWSP